MTGLIKDWPDKQLQQRINEYFGAFINYDAEGLRNCQSEDFTMNDNRKHPSPSRSFSGIHRVSYGR